MARQQLGAAPLRVTDAARHGDVLARMPVVSVRHPQFGAVGDGTADDTAAIAAAYTTAAAAGKPLYLPAGTYRVTALPDFANNTEIHGDGRWATTILYAGTGTLRTLTGKQFVAFRHLQIYLTAAGAKGIQLSGCFRCSFESVLIRGNYQGDGAATYKGQVGIVLDANTGGTFFNEVDIQNLGVGLRTSCIENEMVNCKFTVCFQSVHGVGGTANAGMYLTNVEFVGGDGMGSTDVHILIDGSANSWSLTSCWLEKGDYGARIGVVGSGGPSQFAMFGCKVGARVTGLLFNNCRQPHLDNVQFDLDQGGTMKEIDFATVGGTYGGEAIEGAAINLVTTLRDDFQFADFPQYWAVIRKGNAAFGNLRSRSNIDADGRVTASSYAVTYLPGNLRVMQSDADGLLTPVHKQASLAWDAEIPLNAAAIAAGYVGYSDAIGGVQVNNPYTTAGILLDSVGFRIANPTGRIGGSGNFQVQFYLGTPTSAEDTLIATMQIAAGSAAASNSQSIALGKPVACAHNAVLRAKITSGSATLPGRAHVHWRGRYQNV